MKNRKYFFFLFVALLLFVFAFVVMFLWNAILPDLLQIRSINYWQALGLIILCRLLVGGFGKPPFAGPPPHMRNKWMNMNEEERTKFKEEWKKRFEGRRE